MQLELQETTFPVTEKLQDPWCQALLVSVILLSFQAAQSILTFSGTQMLTFFCINQQQKKNHLFYNFLRLRFLSYKIFKKTVNEEKNVAEEPPKESLEDKTRRVTSTSSAL